MNPAVGGAFIVQDRNFTKYDSLQLELRRRLSRGLLVSANYTYGVRKVSAVKSIRFDRITVEDAGSLNGTYVNRDRIEKVQLKDSDEVQVGKYRLVFFAGHESA